MLTKIYPSYPNWRRVKINPGIVSIENIASLRAHIITFNRNFLRHKVSVEEEDEVRKNVYMFLIILKVHSIIAMAHSGEYYRPII
ncbi:hypothetical protein BH18THE1_BH18THE1_09350 [soil metagenome]